jgi:DNA-binding NtrC family response regulator
MENVRVTKPNEAATDGMIHQRSLEYKIAMVKKIVLALLSEIEDIQNIQSINIDDCIDLSEEVRRFEMELINKALQLTSNHQARAARILRIKATTLNAKIKRYNLQPTIL